MAVWRRAFSKDANPRTDAYGGRFENRSRFLRETLASVRQVRPEKFPRARLGVAQFNGTMDEDMEEALTLTHQIMEDGLDFMSVSLSFPTPQAQPQGFVGPIAKRIRDKARRPLASAWGFGTPEVAEAAVRNTKPDVVMIGKAHLASPHRTDEAARAAESRAPVMGHPARALRALAGT
ncbi:oxidoreductase [Falsigemmobacter faecalis]|uniref:oxidoreductase n=1 Tax=Falsigemmobacter faecalis TaxID=2488730 RepID=UPI0026802AB1|nr:hypothetical protein [Falsigemmobacter faecalis]